MFGRGFLSLVSFVWRHKFKALSAVFGVAFLVSSVWWYTGLSASDIPTWGWVAIAVVVLTTPYAIAISTFAISLVFRPYDVVLHELEPETGDIAVHDLAADRYEDLVVVDANGTEIGKQYLHEIDVRRAGQAYEVTSYNPETNVAEVSWMGEASNADIRRHQEITEQLKESLSPLARAYRDMHAKMDIVVEQRVSDAVGSVMAMVEKVTLPPGERLEDQMSIEVGETELEQLPDPDEELDDISSPTPREVEQGEADTAPDAGGDRR